MLISYLNTGCDELFEFILIYPWVLGRHWTSDEWLVYVLVEMSKLRHNLVPAGGFSLIMYRIMLSSSSK